MAETQKAGSLILDGLWGFLQLVSFLFILWYGLTVSVRRFHDFGWSGWCVLLIPFVGIALIFGPGDKGDNKYGPSPKA